MLNNLLSPFWSVFCIELFSASFGIVWQIGKYFGELITVISKAFSRRKRISCYRNVSCNFYGTYNFVLIFYISSHKAIKSVADMLFWVIYFIFSQIVTLSSLIYGLCVWFTKCIFCVKFSVHFGEKIQNNNSTNIKVRALKSLAFDREPNFG